MGRHPGLCLLVTAPSAHHTTPHHTTPHHTTPHHTTPHHTTPHHTTPHHTTPHHTTPHHTTPYHTIPYHTIPYHTIPLPYHYHTIPLPYHTIPPPPPDGTLSYCTWEQDAASTEMQQENRLVSGLVDHRYRSVAKLRHRGTPVDRPPTCNAMVRSGTSQATAKLGPLDLDCRLCSEFTYHRKLRTPPLCDIPSGCCFLTGPCTVSRSSLRVLRQVAAFCRPLQPVLLLVSCLRSRSPVAGVPGLCWMWQDVPFVR